MTAIQQARAEEYLELATIALRRPRQYRAGTEARLRSIWKSLGDEGRALVEENYR